MIYTQQKELHSLIETLKNQGKTIGLVPTMGALHDGHLSLIKKAKKENDIAVVSIFVNPTQFNNPTDLEKYPRTLTADADKIAQYSKEVIIFAPTVDDIYGKEVVAQPFDFAGLDKVMEGSSRPGHFDGVVTVVEELFRQVQPDNAYFGDKDFQQLAIIKKLVQKLQLPINIVGMPIFRENSGLAMSSRNMRLSPEQRDKAKLIYATLVKANEMFRKSSLSDVKTFVEKTFENSDFELEYFIIADEETLKEVDKIENGRNYRAFIVVLVDGVRLIDNIHLD